MLKMMTPAVTTPAMGVRAPNSPASRLRVRLPKPDGMPPKKDVAMLAAPSATSSRLGEIE